MEHLSPQQISVESELAKPMTPERKKALLDLVRETKEQVIKRNKNLEFQDLVYDFYQELLAEYKDIQINNCLLIHPIISSTIEKGWEETMNFDLPKREIERFIYSEALPLAGITELPESLK